jgi:thermitase
MTPIMSAAMDTLMPSYLADLNAANEPSDTPVLGPATRRWDLLQIKAAEGWKTLSGSLDAVVAVLDTGIDINHRSLKGKVIESTSFTTSTGIDADRGHGTHIAGIIAGAADDVDTAGIAYNARLLDVKVAENDGSTDAQKVARGIIWAANHGAKVINISIVINQPYPFLEYAVDYAWKKGCVIVAAAGNSASSTPVYPASYPNVIAVAATDKNDLLARWSNRGDWISLAAPGVDIYSSLPDNNYGYKSGTSFSAALVSGEAALLYPLASDADNDGLVNDDMRDLILSHCDKVENLNPQRRINVSDAAQAVALLREDTVD